MRLAAGAHRYDLLMLFQTGRSHMVVLTMPHTSLPTSRPGTPLEDGPAAAQAAGTPPQTGDLAASIQDLKDSHTPPHRCML